MFHRKAYNTLLQWKHDFAGSTALLLEGARRVGKTTLVTEFGRNEYESCLIIDFTTASASLKSYFTDLIGDLDSFFLYLQAETGVKLHKRKSLVVFDEVQAYPLARQSIKHLVADGRYDYIETGSLLSLRKNVENILIPSEEHAVRIDPFDFDEFLSARGEDALCDVIHRQFEALQPLPDALHRKASRMFREYLLVGGMPQAIAEFVQSADLDRTEQVKRAILELYRNDIAKFAGASAARIRQAFDAIPSQLARKTKRFTFSRIGNGARSETIESAFDWLDDAFVVNRCYRCSDPSLDLASTADFSQYKCYLADTGLLVSLTFPDAAIAQGGVMADILTGKISINEGMFAENVVAQCLTASGHDLFYWAHYDETAKRSYEVDFLVPRSYDTSMRPRIAPVEIKSGKGIAARSLTELEVRLRGHKRLAESIVLSPRQLCVQNDGSSNSEREGRRRLVIPLYMAGCL